MEGMDNAQGRFVYLRSFESARMLRVDGVKIYRQASRRRLEQDYEHEFEKLLDQVEHESESVHATEDEANKEADKHFQEHMHKLKVNMVNLTKTVCNDRKRNPENALKVRREAAVLWAELDETASAEACWDCVSLRAINCTVWFTHPFGLRNEVGENAKHTRRLKESLKEQEEERRRLIEEGVGKACCRRNKRTGETDCKREYCDKVFQQQAHSRMGHILRRMHEKGHIDMSVDQRVAVDIISPHLHSDPRCRSQDPHSKRIDGDVSEVECIASSLVNHIAAKHGLSKDSIDTELGKYGLSVAKMIAQPLMVASTATETMSNFKSNPVFADMAAKVRAKQRSEEESNRRSLHQRTGFHGRSLKSARAAVEEHKSQGALAKPKPKKQIKSRSRKLQQDTHGWLHNASHFASRVHKAASLSRASSLMPQVHSPEPPSYFEIGKETMAAIVSAEGSVVGTTIKSAQSVSNLVADGYDLMERVTRAAEENLNKQQPRRLSESSMSAFFDQVEERFAADMAKRSGDGGRHLSAREVGITIPSEHVREHGWIAGAADWKQVVKDTHTIAGRLLKRRDDMLDHVHENGELPSGPLKAEHKTGVSMLDMNVPPSKIGNMFRELHAWVTNRHRSKPLRQDHARRMKESLRTTRPANEDHHESVLAAAMESAVIGNDAMSAVWNTLENSNHHRTSRMRKLAEGFLGAAATVPLLQTSVSNKYSAYDETEGGYNFFTELTRYIVYGALHEPLVLHYTQSTSSNLAVCASADVFLCYLYSPDPTVEARDFGDGTRVETHRTRRMCVPMVPSGPSKMLNFRQYYELGDFNFDDLEFETACSADSVKSVLGALGQDWASNTITTAPMGAILRVAEGIDSIRNLALSGMNATSGVQRGSAIVCGLSQLGGLIFCVLAIIVSLALCICAPFGSAIAMWIYSRVTMTDEALAERDRQIDELLKDRGKSVGAFRATRLDRVRVGTELEALLPLR